MLQLLAFPFFALVVSLLSAGLVPARADDLWSGLWSRPAVPYYELSTGADAVKGSWSVYGGVTTALFRSIREDGWRLRSSGGYGRYRYARPAFDPATKRTAWPEFNGEMTFADALLGYQVTYGPLVLKAFAGISAEQHLIAPRAGSFLAVDDANAVQGERYGFKGALETWLNLGDTGFLQFDGSWSEPFSAYSSRLRLGYRLDAGWSAGPEAAVFGNANHDHGRLGGFVRREWSWGEASLSAGADGDAKAVGGAYGSVALMLRF